MYEVFLTAVIADDDTLAARSVLQGFCSLSERHTFKRLMFFISPDRPVGLTTIRDLQKQKNQNGKLWTDLHTILTRQSYIMQARLPADESALREGRESTDVASRFGTLRWNDIPDALGSRATVHVQRKIMEIYTPELVRILRDNNFKRKSEAIEESYTWWLDGIEYALVRVHVPAAAIPPGATTLPPLAEAFRPLAPFWTLSLRTVVDDASPERIQEAVRQLTEVREKLAGVFDFRAFDRLVHDPRIIERQNNIPVPLPQVVRA